MVAKKFASGPAVDTKDDRSTIQPRTMRRRRTRDTLGVKYMLVDTWGNRRFLGQRKKRHDGIPPSRSELSVAGDGRLPIGKGGRVCYKKRRFAHFGVKNLDSGG